MGGDRGEGGAERCVWGEYIAVVVLDVRVPEYYMLTDIRNYVDMI